MPIRGTIIERVQTPDVPGVTRAALDRAAKQVAAEWKLDIASRCSRPNPTGKNPSRPGQYPKMVTGEHVTGFDVIGTFRGITITSVAEHSKYLQSGTIHMQPRPWVRNAPRWFSRIAELAERELRSRSRR